MTIALLSDVHANLVALEAVLAELPATEELWVMGDTVGYGPDPSDVLALLRERGARLIAGNHDRAVATGEGLGLFNPMARAAATLHQAWLSAGERDVLAALPLTFVGRERYLVCHGSPRDPLWEYVFDRGAAERSMASTAVPNCCNGHTHVPALLEVGDGRLMVNPGSVGQPRDGDARAAYALLDPDTGSVQFRRATYDVAETQRRMRALRLPELLADRLGYGL